MGEEIILQKKHKNIVAAKLYLTFYRPQIKIFLAFFSFAGVLSLAALYFGVLPDALSFWLSRALVIFGLFSFVFYVFIFHYVRSFFEWGVIGQEYNYFDFFDPEATLIVGNEPESSPDLLKVFQKILTSKRGSFIVSEGQINEFALKTLVEGLPKSVVGNLVLKNVLVDALSLAVEEGRGSVTAADLFWGFYLISKNQEKFLLDLELEESDVKNLIFWANRYYDRQEFPRTATEKLEAASPGLGSDWSSGYTLNLDRYATEVTPRGVYSVEGREQVVNQIEDILTKEAKNNCILSGPVGVGKTTLVKGLAERIYWGESNERLVHWRILELNGGAIISAGKSKSDTQTVLTACLNDAVRAGNIILFIDEIHQFFSGGKEGTLDATEIFLPYLESSKIKILGTTTAVQYETYLAPKSNIAANFEKIEVAPTEQGPTLRILEDLALKKQSDYGVRITYFAIKEIFLASEKFNHSKEFPAKAIDLLDEIFSAARNAKLPAIDKSDVFSLLERELGVPVGEAKAEEKTVLLELEDKIHSRVIAQNEAVKAVADSLKIARTKGTSNKRPIGTFLFLGPTGVGKTELAKALAWAYFGDEKKIVRMDLNEFQDQRSTERLIGVKRPGKEELEGGDFVKKIKENPFSLILLDEIEKAAPSILDLFLQAIDEGYFIDGLGEKINLSNNIIIATSNAGALTIKNGIESGRAYDDLKKEVLEEVQKAGTFKPEFLNRFDGVILFRPLTEDELVQVARLMFAEIAQDYEAKGYKIVLEEGLLEMLAKEGYHPEMGARPMRRVFQDKLESYLANEILSGSLKKGETFTVAVSALTPKT